MVRLLVASLLVLVSFNASAVLPPQSAQELAASADRVIVGVVESIDVSQKRVERGHVDNVYALRIRVEKVEKGRPTKAISIIGWTMHTRPDGWVGPSGNDGIQQVTVGDHVRAYIKGNNILEPNGIERLALHPVQSKGR